MKMNYVKILFYILAPVIVSGFVYLNGYPGDTTLFMKDRVSEKHAYMERKCEKCHIPWKGVSNDSCIACHVDDRHYITNEAEKAAVLKLRCFDCHQEHRGRSYDPEVAEYLHSQC